MEVDLTDFQCERVEADVFKCVAEASPDPIWFYPVVIACFVMALVILVLVARMTLKNPKPQNRRLGDKPTPVEITGEPIAVVVTNDTTKEEE